MTHVAINPSVIYRELSGEVVLLNLQSGVYYGLDTVGSRIWQLLMESRGLDEVCAIMLDEYDVDPDTLRADVETLVGELSDKGLVMVASGDLH
ncbi:MAG TPA: PqqD family protein [Vicinamibacterales bacterium]